MAKQIPGPTGQPIIGYKRQLDMDKLHVVFYNLKKKYGGIVQFTVMSERFVVISDVDLLKKAFQKKEMCHRPTTFVSSLKYNSGYLNSNYTDRELAIRTSVMNAIGVVQDDVMLRDLGAQEIESFLTSLDETDDIPILDLLKKTAARKYSVMISGIQASDIHSDVVVEYVNSMNNIYTEGKVTLLTKFPWLQYMPGSFKSATKRVKKARHHITSVLVTEAIRNYQPAREHGILQHMLKDEQSRGNDNKVSERNLIGCTMDLLFNSVLPTAQNVAFVLLQSIKHPEMQRKIHDEIREVSKNIDASGILLENVPYMEAFILECMRYVSTVDVAPGHWVSEDTEVDGYLFPKGTIIFADIFGIHHDEEVWDQPWTFNPDRFLDEEGKCIPKTDPLHKYVVHFCMGLRQCRGSNIALETISSYVIGIFLRYKVLPPVDSNLPSSDPRDYTTTLIINVPDFKCRFEKKHHAVRL